MKLRLAAPSALIDIGRIAELKGISAAGGGVRIGALTTHADVAASDVVRAVVPVARRGGGPDRRPGGAQSRHHRRQRRARRSRRPICPTVLVALDATVDVAGAEGERTVAADDFFVGMMTTALGDGEILGRDLGAGDGQGSGAAYVKFAHPASRYAVIGVGRAS